MKATAIVIVLLVSTPLLAQEERGALSVAASAAESMVFSKRILPLPGTPEQESYDRVMDVVRRYELGELTASRTFARELEKVVSPCLESDEGAACSPVAAKAIFELALFHIDTDYAARDISARFITSYETEPEEGEAPAPDAYKDEPARGLPLLDGLVQRFPDSPFSPFAIYLLAYEMRVGEKLELSTRWLLRFLKDHPGHGYVPAVSLLLGHNLYEQGKYDLAAGAYERASSRGSEADEDHDLSLYRLGWCRLRLFDYPGALKALLPLALKANEPVTGVRRSRRAHFRKEARILVELALADLDWDGDGRADFETAAEFLDRARQLLNENRAGDQAESLLKKARERLSGAPEPE